MKVSKNRKPVLNQFSTPENRFAKITGFNIPNNNSY